jgi:hypothetical protein
VENSSFEAKWKLRLKYGIMLKQCDKKAIKNSLVLKIPLLNLLANFIITQVKLSFLSIKKSWWAKNIMQHFNIFASDMIKQTIIIDLLLRI